MAKNIGDLSKVLNIDNRLALYHNSKGGFKGDPSVTYGRKTCDFGAGIYLSTDILRVSSIGRSSKSVCYKTDIYLDKVNVYRFDNIYLFYLYCILNRMDMVDQVPEEIKYFVDKMNSYDLLIGETLDGYDIYNVLNSFVYGSARLDDVNAKLKLSTLGLQYCIKSQVLLNSLHFSVVSSNESVVDKEEDLDRPLLSQSVDDLKFSDLIFRVKELL